MKKRKKDIRPITDDQVLRVLSSARRPVGIDELESIFRRGKPNRRELLKLLGALIAKGRVIELRNKRFGLTKEMDLISGTLACTRSGNGFVIPDAEGVKDIFVSSRNFNNAVHGDKVTVRLDHYARGKPEGKIIRITQRKSNNIIGFTKSSDNILYVIPEDWRYNIEYKVVRSKTDIGDGRLVVAQVTAFPGEKVEPECRITKVLRDLTSVSSISKFIEYKHSLSGRFSKAMEQEARDRVAPLVPSGRKDLRNLRFVTIDGKNARDFDDAVAIERSSHGFILHVAIADVSHYVRAGSLLDQEAFKRGTSVYFPTGFPSAKTLPNAYAASIPRDSYTSPRA